MERLFVDTSGWYALLNRNDGTHAAVRAVLDAWQGRLVTTDYIVDELVTLVRMRVGHALAVRAGEALLHGDVATLVEVERDDLERAWEQFCRDQATSYSFTDCTSFAVMRRLSMTGAVALDEHFVRAGFVALPAGQASAARPLRQGRPAAARGVGTGRARDGSRRKPSP